MAVSIPQVVTEDRASGAQFIDGSLKFDSGSRHYLNRTPSSTGNRQTWTWSAWVKFANIDKNDQVLFSAVTGSSYIHFRFMGVDSTNSRSHKLNFQMYDGSTSWNLYTRRTLRDSGWYHLLLQVDYTQATAADRTKIYVNGELTDQVGASNNDSASFAAQNYETYANLSGAVNNIGYHSTYGEYFDGKISNVYLIDGQALGPEEFGFTDELTNTWRPKKYDGTFGTNGFWLPMDGNTPIGKDQSGRGNDWTPVTFGGSVALDNPQVSGAFPILKTNDAGSVAKPGVRTDSKTYTVTASGGKYYLDGVETPTLNFLRGGTYIFDYTGATSHPFKFSTTADGTHGGGSEYTDGTNTATSNVMKITVPHNAPDTLYYYCSAHSGMGSSINVTTDVLKADPYAWKCVAALPLVGSQHDVSNQINSGSSTKTVSVNGNAAASPDTGNFYSSSFEFDGTNDDVRTTPGAIGTVDFTLECWVNPDVNNANQATVDTRDNSNTNGTGFSLRSDGTVRMFDGTALLGSGTSYSAGKWIHLAASRSGSTLKFFVNGKLIDNLSNTTNFSNNRLIVGTIGSGSEDLDGYVQDVRLYIGVAKYTSDFVVGSTSPDILPETPSGITGKTNLAKITEGAVAFRGDNDRLEVPKSTNFDFPGEFTMEGWIYANSLPTGADHHNEVKTIFESIDWNSQLGQYQFGISNNNRVQFYVYNNSNTYIKGTTTLGIGRWYHLAVSRDSSNNIRLFVNGVLETTSNNSYSLSNSNQPNPARIGQTKISNVYKSLDGFISNVRVIKGTALYTSNFTPPTEPLTEVTNTKLLCCQSNTSTTAAAVGSISSSTGGGYAFTNAKAYSVYSGGARAANYTVQWSDDNSNWTDAWSGNMHNNNSCGIIQGTGSGNPGPHQYWRYVENSSTVGHHPRVSRIILNDGTTDINIRVYTGDNCSDSGDYVIGTTSTYTDSTYSSASTAKATKFNPFTDDINTVRGQETGYATLNPLDKGSSSTLSDGNLRFAGVSSAHRGVRATIKPTVKIYAEMLISDNEIGIGFASSFVGLDNSTLVNGKWVVYNNQLRSNGSSIASITTLGAGEIIQVAYDPVTTASWIGRNNKWYDSSGTFTGNPATGANPTFYIPDAFIYVHSYNAFVVDANFGQKPFKFPPPDGFQPLSLSNVQPEKVIARPDQYVSATLFTGTGDAVSSRTVELPHAADLVWAKSRDRTSSNQLLDTVRGDNLVLQSNSTSNDRNPITQYTGGGLSTIDGKTITIASGTTNNQNLNVNGNRGVIWSWKAGGSKNTFNIDGEGYANASDVNMNVGGLNSQVYNDDQVWSSGLSGSGSGGGWASGEGPTVAFNGDIVTRSRWTGTSSGVITASFTAISATKLRVKGHFFKNNTTANEDVMISVNGGTYVIPSDAGLITYDEIQAAAGNNLFIDASSLITGGQVSSVSIKRRGSVSSGSGLTIYAIEVDGKILVDSNQTPPNAPSTATTGCSVGTKQGFSIIRYNGNNANRTIAHGLSEPPKFWIYKNLTDSTNWAVNHTIFGSMRYLYLNLTNTQGDNSSSYWGNMPTSDLLYIGADNDTNGDGDDHIIYAWHDVPGLQKFGRYEGNTTEGAFVELGFRPAIIWIKAIDQTWYWNIHDSKRSPINPGEGNFLRPDQNFVEGTASGNNNIDFLSNGFKIRSTTSNSEPTNVNGQSYIYCAWAEAPSINLYGAQSNAR